MANRREFVQSGIALSALAVAPFARSAHAGATPTTLTPFKIFVDRTLEASTGFAAEAARRGASVQMIGSDIGGAWMNQIEPRWQQSPAAIAGLTGGAPLFCLELLARGYGMRVVYRFEHAPRADGRMAHYMTGPEALADWAGALTTANADWSALAAALATTCPQPLRPSADIPLVDLSERPGIAQRSLFSWVIAPHARSRMTA
jgi:hypothetical protein